MPGLNRPTLTASACVKPWPNDSTQVSTQFCITRTCVLTCDGWPNGFASRLARLLAINLCQLALGVQTVKNLRLLTSRFELNRSQRKSMQVAASRCKSTQVGGQTSPFGQGLRLYNISKMHAFPMFQHYRKKNDSGFTLASRVPANIVFLVLVY